MARTAADVQTEIDALRLAHALVQATRSNLQYRAWLAGESDRRRREAQARRRAFRDRVAEINGGWVL